MQNKIYKLKIHKKCISFLLPNIFVISDQRSQKGCPLWKKVSGLLFCSREVFKSLKIHISMLNAIVYF